MIHLPWREARLGHFSAQLRVSAGRQPTAQDHQNRHHVPDWGTDAASTREPVSTLEAGDGWPCRDYRPGRRRRPRNDHRAWYTDNQRIRRAHRRRRRTRISISKSPSRLCWRKCKPSPAWTQWAKQLL